MKISNKEKEYLLKSRKRLKSIQKSARNIVARKKSNPSRGEQRIIDFLTSEMINFRREWWWSTCRSPKTGYLLFFDFILPDYNLVIEYDGEQHYSKDKTECQIINDFTKTAYCAKNQVNLLRIKYTDFDKIEQLICAKIDKIEGRVYPIKSIEF